MKHILAIECSQSQASLCLYQSGCISYQQTWYAQRNHDAYLFPALEEALQQLGEAPLDSIIVGAGPGSYGGVRVAIAAATGLALIKKCPIACIDSWAQLAQNIYTIISDAKRQSWTVRHPQGQIDVQSSEEVRALLKQGHRLLTLESASKMQEHAINCEQTELNPTAEGLIQSWLQLSPAKQEEMLALAPSPIYVRPPHITQAKKKPWEC